MKQSTKAIVGVIALVLFLGGAAVVYNILSREVTPEIEMVESDGSDRRRAPDFTVIDTAGNQVNLSDLIVNEQPIVVNFWASWCPPCKEEMPDFENVYQDLGDEVQFMMVSVVDGRRETIESATQFVAEGGFTFPVYFDTEQEGARAYGIQAIPTTIFIDSNGNIVHEILGKIDEETLRKGIDSL